MQAKLIALSAAAENCLFAAGATLSQIARRKGNLFAVKHGFSLSGENNIDFLVLFVGVNEWNACTRRKIVDADLGSGQREHVMKLCSCFVSYVDLAEIFHDKNLRLVILRPYKAGCIFDLLVVTFVVTIAIIHTFVVMSIVTTKIFKKFRSTAFLPCSDKLS